jgi:hypothetical protein
MKMKATTKRYKFLILKRIGVVFSTPFKQLKSAILMKK